MMTYANYNIMNKQQYKMLYFFRKFVLVSSQLDIWAILWDLGLLIMLKEMYKQSSSTLK